MKKMIALLLIAIAAVSLAAEGSFTVKRYEPSDAEQSLSAALDTIAVYDDRLALGRKFRDEFPDDVGVQVRVTDLLAVDNPDAVRDYYKHRAQAHPDNVIAQFLAGRIAKLVADRKEYAAAIFKLEPNSHWGYIVQAFSFYPEEDADFKQAESALRSAIEVDNSKPYALWMLAEILRNTDRVAEADYVYEQLSKMLPGDFNPVQQRLMLIPGQFQKHLERIDEFLERQPESVLALDLRARVYRELGDWDGYIESMQRAVAVLPDGINLYNLACGFSLTAQPDSAFARLNQATDAGFSDVEAYRDDDDLLPLHDDERWVELLTRVEDNHQRELLQLSRAQAKKALEQQQQPIPERTQDMMAPDFTALLFDSTEVTLSDLRGKVVVLDFWATWCGPCRKTMPLVDKFYKEVRGEDVLVYGVNVWERRGTAGVKPYIEKQGYSFPILLAENQVAAQYGVRGIPTLFIIDKTGKIAYKHIGFNPQIIQILAAETEELSGAKVKDE